ncbi:unnamed protein product, partial [Rotaria sordida]
CSQYRTFTKCQYQLKAKIYHDSTYQFFYSQHHEHELLEDTRLPTDIRSNIRDLAMKEDFNNESINASIAAVGVASATPHSSTTAPKPEHIEKTFKKVLEKN